MSIAAPTDALADAPNTVMSATSATPIISAAAVADVRFGFRFAFSSASRPVMPFILRIGRPSTALIGRAMIGPSTATPMKMTNAPSPTACSALLPPPKRPLSTSAIPSAVTTRPATVRFHEPAD